jgi:hypothetical protein
VGTRFVPRDAARQKLIVPRVGVANVGANAELDGARLELLGQRRTADATRAPLAGVLGNRPSFLVGAAGKQFSEPPREPLDVLGIELPPSFLGALTGQSSRLGVRQALLLRSCEGSFLDQEALPLVSVPRTAESDDDRAEGRIPAGSPRECGVPARQEDQTIQIGASQA